MVTICESVSSTGAHPPRLVSIFHHRQTATTILKKNRGSPLQRPHFLAGTTTNCAVSGRVGVYPKTRTPATFTYGKIRGRDQTKATNAYRTMTQRYISD